MRNFGSYAAAPAGYTVRIIAGDVLGATGGVNADAAFLIAVRRASEVCTGIICASIVPDLGAAPRRPAAPFASLSGALTSGFTAGDGRARTPRHRSRFDANSSAGSSPSTRPAILRLSSPVSQRRWDGLFAALAGWREMANHLVLLAHDAPGKTPAVILQSPAAELRSPQEHGEPARWSADVTGLHRICQAAIRRLIALPADTPSRCLLADKTAELMAGVAPRLNGLALLIPARFDVSACQIGCPLQSMPHARSS